MSTTVTTRSIPPERRPEAEATWRRLEQRTGSRGLTCSWTWTGTWLAHFGDVVPHRFVVGTRDGEDVGVALVTEGAARYPAVVGARLAHVGTAGEPRGSSVFVERNRLLVGPVDRDAFAVALLADIRADRRWDRLVIPGLDAGDADALRRADPRLLLDEQESPVAALTAGADPLDALASGTRRRVRRALKGLAPLEVDWADDPEEGRAVMDELIELHQLRWRATGEPGAFASTRFTAFHRALIDQLGPGRGVVLVRVRRGAETMGCVYGPVEDGEVLFYQGGMRRSEDNKLNVGLAVHLCAMRACAERGLRAYDLLAPASRYKRDLAPATNRLVWASLARNRPRAHVDRALRALQARRALRSAAR